MRQAGRHLPEYLKVRATCTDFIDFCFTPDKAAEVTLQPIRRYDMDAAILFADILLIPIGLGRKVTFVKGTGPVLEPIDTDGISALTIPGAADRISSVWETVAKVRAGLDKDKALIGFAGGPWTVATYMIAGQGTKDQGPAHALKAENTPLFDAVMDRLTAATIEYLSMQIEAGAEVVKLFDSWAGSLKGEDFQKYALEPARVITTELKKRPPGIPVIGFPREAGDGYIGFAKATGVDCVAIDNSVSPEWAAANVQVDGCVQGNLASRHMVTGGQELVDETRKVVEAFKNGPHIFNLGHGITPDADPENVQLMIDTVRNG